MKKVLMSWSSGKDSAWALYKLQQDHAVDLAGIFCTLTEEFQRVSMHGVKVDLLQKQAENIGIPLEIIEIPHPCTNEQYEKTMAGFVENAKKKNIECFAFGDLFLENIREYRKKMLKGSGIEPVFPVWGIPTNKLIREMLKHGLRTVITCVDCQQISKEFVGREINEEILELLPENTDPCGENGEFHSFVFDGPMFKQKIEITTGDIIERGQFVFVDVLLL